MVMLRPSKPTTWVRFPSPAPFNEKTVPKIRETVFSFPPQKKGSDILFPGKSTGVFAICHSRLIVITMYNVVYG